MVALDPTGYPHGDRADDGTVTTTGGAVIGRPPTDQQLYDDLVTALRRHGEVEEDADQGVVRLLGYADHPLAVPFTLHVTPRSLGAVVREGEAEGTIAFPRTQPARASWTLLLEQVDEAVRTARTGETELVIDHGGIVRARRP